MNRRGELSRARSLKRRRPTLQPRQKFLLFCEGQVTERNYFEYTRRALRDYLLTIEVSKELGDPLGLVKAAISARDRASARARRDRDDNLKYDQVWCILDVDGHSRLAPALKLASEENIRIALSNPCFERWLLLHFVARTAYLTTAAAQQQLKTHVQGYDKHLNCRVIEGKYETARLRAQKLAEQHERDGKLKNTNPSSDIWHLVDELLSAARRSNTPIFLSSL